MKTSPLARLIVRIRPVILGIALLVSTVAAFHVGDSIEERFGKLNAGTVGAPHVPTITLHELMATTP